MRYCGTVDTVPSYEKIIRCKDGTPTIQSRKAGEKGLGASPARLERKPRCPAERFESQNPKQAHSKSEIHMKKVGFVDILLGYQSLLQACNPAITSNKRELHPTIGFVRNQQKHSK